MNNSGMSNFKKSDEKFGLILNGDGEHEINNNNNNNNNNTKSILTILGHTLSIKCH
jgi:hypothetical protein